MFLERKPIEPGHRGVQQSQSQEAILFDRVPRLLLAVDRNQVAFPARHHGRHARRDRPARSIEIEVLQYQDVLWCGRDGRDAIQVPTDDARRREAQRHLACDEAVYMGMHPEEARLVIRRDSKAILRVGLPGHLANTSSAELSGGTCRP
jgi:hypothetical protein